MLQVAERAPKQQSEKNPELLVSEDYLMAMASLMLNSKWQQGNTSGFFNRTG